MSRTYIDRHTSTVDLSASLARGLEWVGARRTIQPNARVFIKPNLTWKHPTPGVTVTPLFLRALVENLLAMTRNITVGESQGGQGCFHAEEAFESHGLYDLQREHGIQVLNLSKGRHELATAMVNGKPITVELPSLLLHGVDVFITVPVPKIHAMTVVSIGFKNQWGCLGDKMRVTQHPRFAHTILAINKLLKPQLCICDGTYFLDHTGPMTGEAVRMDLVVIGNDVGATSLACCQIMGVDPCSVPHYRLARHEGIFPASLDPGTCNHPPELFLRRPFHLHRAPLNYLHLAAFHNRPLNRLFYDSPAAGLLHELLWFIRRNSAVQHFLYGKYGPGEASRGDRAPSPLSRAQRERSVRP